MQQTTKFSLWRGLRLSSFQIGSAMGDILITSIWNRILIVNFGIPATPVSLLIGLRYLLSPLTLWAGNLTDSRYFFGLRRTPIIWLGRLMMVLSLPLLFLNVMLLEQSAADPLAWALAVLSSLLYGIGTLISGSPFLALVRESAPERLQGVAISMIQTALIICFAVAGIAFSIWMPAYDPEVFRQMIIATMIIGGFFWLFSTAGIESKRVDLRADAQPAASDRLREVLPKIWSDRRTQLFFAFLSLGAMSAWAHEAILEPFGADVFGLSMGVTTRFNSYWQTATVITLVLGGIAWRKRPPEAQQRISAAGLLVMALGMVMLMLAGIGGQERLVMPGLLVFGGGFGVYTYGGVSLMAVMSPDRHAGVYLGLWTISNLVFKGLGTFLGGALRDLFLLRMNLSPGISYGIIFVLQALGLAAAVLVLLRIDIFGFARDTGRHVDIIETEIAAAG